MSDSLSFNTDDLVAWVMDLQAGKPDAAEPTFRKIVARVEVLTRAMFAKFPRIGRFVEVDDVIQNALIRLLTAFRSIRPLSTRHFYALTNELIRRELLDLAKHYYGPRGHGTNLAATSVGGSPSGADLADPGVELDRFTAFHEAVAALPVEQREVIGLAYYHGWLQQDIANLFNVSVRTVQRWQDDATTAIRAKTVAE